MASRDAKIREKSRQRLAKSYRDADFSYDYPYGKDFRPTSELTAFILGEINRRCAMSAAIRTDYMPYWQEADRVLRFYMPSSEWDRKRKMRDPRKPITIVLPISFNIRETFVSHMASVFLQRAEIQRYRGVGSPESTIGAILLERVCSRQALWFQEARKLMQHWADAFTYGFGVSGISWSKRTARNRIIRKITELEAEMAKLQGKRFSKDDMLNLPSEFPAVLCEGSELTTIDPYQVFMDGNHNIADVQDAEYFGWQYATSVVKLLERETDPEEELFNARYVRLLAENNGGKSAYWNRTDKRNISGKSTGYYDNPATRDVHVTVMCIQLVPSEWGLSNSDYPQKWVFEVAGDEIIISAQPLDYDHGQFPVVTCAPNLDAHSVAPISHLTSISAIQTACDWLMKAKFDFTTTILNGRLFVNPKKVEMSDLMSGENGQLVRVKSSSYDDDRIDKYVYQLQTQDVTPRNIPDTLMMERMAQEGLGISPAMQGDLRSQSPERPGQLGIEAILSGPRTRMGMIALAIDQQMMIPLAYQKAFNTLQFMDQDVWVPLIGNQEEALRKYFKEEVGNGPDIQVTREMLNITFDVLPSSGLRPNEPDPSAMSELAKTMLANPEVLIDFISQYRHADIIAEFFRSLGVNNIEEFRVVDEEGNGSVQIATAPDQTIQQEVQAGNLVPVGGQGGEGIDIG